jgi:hypothetical protein
MSAPPPHVTRFRREFRVRDIGARYAGWAHLACTSLGSLAAITVCIWLIRDVMLVEWSVLPATFLFANWVEYRVHRGPMHRPSRVPGLGILYRRHATQHHHFYTHDAMTCESTDDFKMILFPPFMLVFLLGGVATPVACALYLATTGNTAFLFAATAMAYFLCYELLHLSYHLPPDSSIGRLPGMARLRTHHTAHHDLGLMSRCNFNITFPICDWLYGTVHTDRHLGS